MNLVEAFNNVRGICDNVRCTKQERAGIDESLQTIAKALQPEPKKVEVDKVAKADKEKKGA